jgi:hypothetical protein
LLCKGCRDQPSRHGRSKDDRPADGRTHGNLTKSAEKAAPRRADPAAEYAGIGAFWIAVIELAQGALDPHRMLS